MTIAVPVARCETAIGTDADQLEVIGSVVEWERFLSVLPACSRKSRLPTLVQWVDVTLGYQRKLVDKASELRWQVEESERLRGRRHRTEHCSRRGGEQIFCVIWVGSTRMLGSKD